jgi:hypothetical protein
VGVGDDEVAGRDPAGALDAVAAGNPAHAHGSLARRLHLGIGGDAAVRGGHFGLGALDLGQRVQLGDGPRE